MAAMEVTRSGKHDTEFMPKAGVPVPQRGGGRCSCPTEGRVISNVVSGTSGTTQQVIQPRTIRAAIA